MAIVAAKIKGNIEEFECVVKKQAKGIIIVHWDFILSQWLNMITSNTMRYTNDTTAKTTKAMLTKNHIASFL